VKNGKPATRGACPLCAIGCSELVRVEADIVEPMDVLVLICAAICLISAPVRFWRALKGIDVVVHSWGGFFDVVIGILLILVVVLW